MTALSELRPTKKYEVIDLVKAAGIDVSDWANFKGGKARAAANPKYCFEWSFIEPKKVAVLNLWFEQIKQRGKNIVFDLNFNKSPDEKGKRNQARVKLAIREKLPFRIVILDGKMGNSKKGSIVYKRQLDPAIWQMTALNQNTGDYTLTRNIHEIISSKIETDNAIDDLANVPEGNNLPDRASAIVKIIKRDNRVRAYVVKRPKGKCEYCGERGFETANGKFYVETHHIIALCDSGRDTVDNVIALCPQHHREAHYGKDAESLEARFVAKLKEINNC
jgi:5-methylcytosine-specific restriction protein A